MQVYLGARKVTLSPTKALGKGGEADVYALDNCALKIYKTPDHPDYANNPIEQQGARERIETAQTKLRAFPLPLGGRVVQPTELATDASGRLVGYAMPLLRHVDPLYLYAHRDSRPGQADNNAVTALLRDLSATVKNVHEARVVIGDFNDLNVLVQGAEARLIDADSLQFGSYLSQVFTARFVDPLLCDPSQSAPAMIRPHNENSDWYALAIMLMECLLYVGPYGGVYVPKNRAALVPLDARPLHRITVFHPEVRYPKPATHYSVLPDDLLDYLHRTFIKDERGVPSSGLLDTLRWTKCSACGKEHARSCCPVCATVSPAAVKEVTRVRGKVVCTRIFKTPGHILQAVVQGGALRYLYHQDNAFGRENGWASPGSLQGGLRFRIAGDRTLIGQGGVLLTLGAAPERLSVDCYRNLPAFDTNGTARYWASGGVLYRDGTLGPEILGNVLQDQTLFWVGPTFGFGFYRAGTLSVAFVFDAEHPGINDTVPFPRLSGQILEARAAFTKERCYFQLSAQEGPHQVHRGLVIDRAGRILARAEAKAGDGSWLSHLTGALPVGNFLLVPTDDGVVRVEQEGKELRVAREFPDTEPFVDAGSRLLPGPGGLYVVGDREIALLKLG
jgi:hypothetical protein